MEQREFVVEQETAGQRIDRFLSGEDTGLSRSALQALVADGHVQCNGKTVAKSLKLKAGDTVLLEIPDAKPIEAVPQDIPLDIVYEDSHLLVVNKPKGMVVHPAPGNPDGTLVNALLWHCKGSLSGIGGEIRPGIVHRIDKDTSGLLVVAKTPEAKTLLGKQFFHKTTHRSYIALVWANFVEEEGRIEGNIARDVRDRLRMAVFPPDSETGKPAVTHWRVLERFGYTTLVECILETGRTHQIRAHMRHIGHPLFGDARYGGTEILRGQRSSTYKAFIQNCLRICPRQALHARTLGFVHPTTGQQMDFTSPLPADLEQLLAKWRGYINGTTQDTFVEQ